MFPYINIKTVLLNLSCFFLQKKKGDMKVKRLKKKIVDEYVKRHGDTVKSRIQVKS